MVEIGKYHKDSVLLVVGMLKMDLGMVLIVDMAQNTEGMVVVSTVAIVEGNFVVTVEDSSVAQVADRVVVNIVAFVEDNLVVDNFVADNFVVDMFVVDTPV